MVIGSHVILAASVLAASEVAPNPSATAYMVPAGHFELMADGAVDQVPGGISYGASLTVRYALLDWLALWVTVPNAIVGSPLQPARGFDGLLAGGKVLVVAEQPAVPQLALSFAMAFPTSLETHAVQHSIDALAMAYVTKSFGPVQLDGTAGVRALDLSGALTTQGHVSLSSTFTFIPQLALQTGAYSWLGSPAAGPVDGGAYAELNIMPLSPLAIAVGAEVGFFPQTRGFSIYAGIAWVPTSARPVLAFPTPRPPALAALHGAPPGE